MPPSREVQWHRQRHSQRLEALQACRMIAAVAVVLFHANNFVLPMRLYDGETLWRGFGMGYAGVEFFFVLSGFIIAHIHAADIGRPERAGRFLQKRFLRIYPPYWIVLSALVLIYVALEGIVSPSRLAPAALLRDYLLIPALERPLLSVAWTLKHEILFYLLFVLFILRREIGFVVCALWLAGTLSQIPAAPETPLFATLFSPYNILFGMGVAAARLHRHLPEGLVWPLLTAGGAGFLLVGLSEQFLVAWPLPLRCLAYGLAAAAVIAALARAQAGAPGWCVFLGDASYAIYLIHLPVMNMVAVPLARTGLQDVLPPAVLFVFLVGLSILAGALFHRGVERGLLAALRPRRRATL
ncbi:acyltransferase family protein [Rhodobacter sphaeroides]|uniref:acyltransferase family protein n=1 Tax=Cereibacter sphaeroides TaxID=1063 RepID=UPI00132C4086|nr:acyltransferase [Cereibacter sphaeroides]MWP38634.1 acyltransferase family protein [Cereibacter sphaeroides]